MDVVTIGNDDLTVTVSPLGAEMQSLVTADGRNWLWSGDPRFWAGRSPILFPIVGRAPADQVSIDGRRYGMNQHGFARRSVFSLAEQTEAACRFVLTSDAASRTVYPFEFTLSVEHRVDGRAVIVTAEVENRDRRPMPFGIGFHPAFAWPLPGAAGEHRVWLDNCGEPPMARLSEGLVMQERRSSPFRHGELTLDRELFAADAMVFPEGAGTGARYGTEAQQVHLTWDNLPNFALWSKPGPFVCLEPWHGTAAEAGGTDALEQRPFCAVLKPGAAGRYALRAELVG